MNLSHRSEFRKHDIPIKLVGPLQKKRLGLFVNRGRDIDILRLLSVLR